MSEDTAETPPLLPDEFIDNAPSLGTSASKLSDSEINNKYVKGEVRIVTEQARYPINSIAGIVEDTSYRAVSAKRVGSLFVLVRQ